MPRQLALYLCERYGIDPETGKMTPAGRAFFEELVAERNRLKRARRTGLTTLPW